MSYFLLCLFLALFILFSPSFVLLLQRSSVVLPLFLSRRPRTSPSRPCSQVRANCMDKHGVLVHSLFYKLAVPSAASANANVLQFEVRGGSSLPCCVHAEWTQRQRTLCV